MLHKIDAPRLRENYPDKRNESERELRPDSFCLSHMKKIFSAFQRWDSNHRNRFYLD